MRIADITSRLYHIPPTVSWEDATHKVGHLEFIVTRVTTDTGLVGEGFTYTTGIGASAVLSLLEDYCTGMLIGENPLETERLWNLLYAQLHRSGTGGINTLALGSIDIALWDIFGKAQSMPLHRLLGARRDSVPTYGSGIDLFLDKSDLLEECDLWLTEGHRAVKIKIGRPDADGDFDRVMAVRSLIGPNRKLFVDANQRWSVPECMVRLQQLAPANLDWIEEPLHAENIAGHADLRRILNRPIAVGESLYTRHQFADYQRLGAMDFVQADVCRVGGITEWLKIAHLAAAYHLPMAPHYLSELSVGLMCAIDNGSILECVRGGSFSEMGVLNDNLRLQDGVALPFDTPGHGISFNDAALAQYEVTPAQLRARSLKSAK